MVGLMSAAEWGIRDPVTTTSSVVTGWVSFGVVLTGLCASEIEDRVMEDNARLKPERNDVAFTFYPLNACATVSEPHPRAAA